MNISKTALWLSVIDALLVLLASASGIFLKSIYARETPSANLAMDGLHIPAVMMTDVKHCELVLRAKCF